MTTRREERERMRQERLGGQQAASASEKRRLYLGYAVAGVIVVQRLDVTALHGAVRTPELP